VKTLCAIAAGSYLIAAFVAASMGLDWLTVGYGLHPAIAAPVALAGGCLACLAADIGDKL